MFNLNIKQGGRTVFFKPLSIAVCYLHDDENIKKDLSSIERKFHVKLSQLQYKKILSKEGKEIWITKPAGKPDTLIISKFKLDDKFTVDHFRNHLAGLVKDLRNEEGKWLHIFLPEFEKVSNQFDDKEYFYRTFIEGPHLGNYEFNKYKKEKKIQKDLSVLFYAEDEKLLKSAIIKTEAVITGVNFTKDLQNEPASSLRPFELANRIKEYLSKEKLQVTIFDEKELKKRNMGGLLAVGQGSSSKPRMIIIHYRPVGNKDKIKKVALVGKGVTFDSGGICVKPAQGMTEMKGDMSGAALVAGTMLVAARMKLSVEIIGVIPSAENMISGEAMRPGDIVTTASGKTIEIGHTDAEGRMILADALDYASRQKPDEIIDFATLTGACVVALGQNAAGLFTKNDELADKLYKVGMKTYDRLWRLPMWDDYNKANETKVADVNNDGGRWGGAITAAKFLEVFVDKNIPWAHIDIAGPASAHELNNYSKDYMTGFGVRLMFEYLSDQ